jgi:hypothetical protein
MRNGFSQNRPKDCRRRAQGRSAADLAYLDRLAARLALAARISPELARVRVMALAVSATGSCYFAPNTCFLLLAQAASIRAGCPPSR